MKASCRELLVMISVIFLLAVCPKAAHADGVQLTLSNVTGAAGQGVGVSGVITNLGTDLVYLNGENFTLGSPNLVNGDVTDFFNNAPLFLSGGTNSGDISIFSFEIAPGTPVGIYTGNFLEILGGPTSSDNLEIASATFSVDVTTAAVPEPTSLSLILSALLVALAVLGFRRLRFLLSVAGEKSDAWLTSTCRLSRFLLNSIKVDLLASRSGPPRFLPPRQRRPTSIKTQSTHRKRC
jgi:hypothetical protein